MDSESILLTLKHVAVSILTMSFLYTNLSILVWAADSKYKLFELPIINDFQDVLDDWLDTIMLVDFVQVPVDFVIKVMEAFHKSPAHDP